MGEVEQQITAVLDGFGENFQKLNADLMAQEVVSKVVAPHLAEMEHERDGLKAELERLKTWPGLMETLAELSQKIAKRDEQDAQRAAHVADLQAKLAEAERELGHYKRVVNGSVPDHLMGRHDKQPGEQCLMCQRNALADENVRLKDELRRWRERPCLDENMNGLECHLQAGHWPDRPHEYVPRSAAVSSGQAPAAGTGEGGPDVEATANLAITSRGLAMHAVLADVIEERFRQDARWGESNHPDGTEDGEFFRIRRDFRRQATKEFAQAGQLTWRHILDEQAHKAYAEVDPKVLREKLIRTAAVAVAWAEAIDRRADFRAGQAGAGETGQGDD